MLKVGAVILYFIPRPIKYKSFELSSVDFTLIRNNRIITSIIEFYFLLFIPK